MLTKASYPTWIKQPRFKKIAFFWILFNLVGYISFLTNIRPNLTFRIDDMDFNIDIITTTPPYMSNQVFYPFQSFFEYDNGYYYYKRLKFEGIWGHYSNEEFLVFVLLPIIIPTCWIQIKRFYNKYIAS